jgi:hypothetical protein
MATRTCPTCGRTAWADALGCAYCKTDFRGLPPVPGDDSRRQVQGTASPWGPPSPKASRRRTIVGFAALVVGLLAAAAAMAFDALYISRGPSRYAGFTLLANIVLIPLAASLLVIGGALLARRRWAKLLIVCLVLAWAVVACYAPVWITGPVQPVL